MFLLSREPIVSCPALFIVNPRRKPYPRVCLRDPKALTEVQDSGLPPFPPSPPVNYRPTPRRHAGLFNGTPTFFFFFLLGVFVWRIKSCSNHISDVEKKTKTKQKQCSCGKVFPFSVFPKIVICNQFLSMSECERGSNVDAGTDSAGDTMVLGL